MKTTRTGSDNEMNGLQAVLGQVDIAAANCLAVPELAAWAVPHRDIMGAVADLLVRGERPPELSRGQLIALTLLTQAYRHTACAFFLAQRCFYEQALTLARSCVANRRC